MPSRYATHSLTFPWANESIDWEMGRCSLYWTLIQGTGRLQMMSAAMTKQHSSPTMACIGLKRCPSCWRMPSYLRKSSRRQPRLCTVRIRTSIPGKHSVLLKITCGRYWKSSARSAITLRSWCHSQGEEIQVVCQEDRLLSP